MPLFMESKLKLMWTIYKHRGERKMKDRKGKIK
jgi:hypothetical protein